MKKTLLYAAITAVIGLSAFVLGQNTKEPEVIAKTVTETVTETVQAEPEIIYMDVPMPIVVEKEVEVPVEVPVEKVVYVPQVQTEVQYIEVPVETPKTALDLNNPNDINMICNLFGQIVDWNTDGNELAVMTASGYEFYAYKSADVYQQRNFVPVQ